jgi:spermidine/putrescine transport system ATP-binding protein
LQASAVTHTVPVAKVGGRGALNAATNEERVLIAEGVSEPDIRLDGVIKRFGETVAVDGLDLSIERGAFYALLGPSGCGKTTTLRMIGGFEDPTEGRVNVAGQDVTDLPPYKRDVNTVFQSYALFPHLDVQKNVAFGLERKKLGKAEVKQRVSDALELTQLGGLERRRPSQLSGGQQQRVALARALVNRPRVLLLDEPLGALDLRLRKQLQVELKRIQQEVGITFVHVTHDQEEAMALADVIAVMNEGKIEQAGSGAELYEKPRTAFVARFLGESNLIAGTLEQGGSFTTHDGARLTIPDTGSALGEYLCGVRPEKVALIPAADGDAPSGLNVLHGRVELASFLGVSIQYLVRTPGGEELTVIQQNTGGQEPHSIGPGREVLITWQPQHTFLVTKETPNG